MQRLLNNLQLFRVSIKEVITVPLSCSVIFIADFDHVCVFHELSRVAKDIWFDLIFKNDLWVFQTNKQKTDVNCDSPWLDDEKNLHSRLLKMALCSILDLQPWPKGSNELESVPPCIHKFASWDMGQNAPGQSDYKIFKSIISVEQSDGKAYFFVFW